MHKTLAIIAAAVCSSILFAQAASAAGMPSMSKHGQRGIACTVCHDGGKFAPAATQKCLACHKSDELVKKTDRLNYVSEMKNPKTGEIKKHTARVNPHDSYHFDRTEDCTDCHREHRASVNDCATCHDVKAWKMKSLK